MILPGPASPPQGVLTYNEKTAEKEKDHVKDFGKRGSRYHYEARSHMKGDHPMIIKDLMKGKKTG